MTLRTVRRMTALLAAVALLRAATSPRARAALARRVERVGRGLRYRAGRLQGLAYRVRDRRPDPHVADVVLTDRVRSALGRVTKRLDIPKVHVTVTDHVATLHGRVPSGADATLVETTVAGISGIDGVESFLHVEPIPTEQLPSGGARNPGPSVAHRRLTDAASAAGAPGDVSHRVVAAVLGFLAEEVPADEIDQFASHLPEDVRAMCRAPRRTGHHRVRTVAQLVADLAPDTAPLSPAGAEQVISSVLGTLRTLVPEEDHDIAATLPDELRRFWLAATPS